MRNFIKGSEDHGTRKVENGCPSAMARIIFCLSMVLGKEGGFSNGVDAVCRVIQTLFPHVKCSICQSLSWLIFQSVAGAGRVS